MASTERDAGLTSAEVRERVVRGQVNAVEERASRTFAEIVRANVLTRFNAILGAMLVLVFVAGSPRDGLFGFVIVINSLIGIVQETRAKRTLDRLELLHAPRARVVRDGASSEVPIAEIVRDDLVELRAGDQVPADGPVTASDGLELDESLLTGESESVDKQPGDQVLSGSIVVAGGGAFRATAVGAQAYARRLAAEARRFTLVRSELMDGINVILRWIQWAIVPAGVLLLVSQLHAHESWQHGLVGAVAGIVAMVPQGLVLLTSMAFAVAAVTLARRQVLVQELPAVEGLARVDVVCVDKTGTITDGDIVFDRLEPAAVPDPGSGAAEELAPAALGALADVDEPNATMAAIRAAFPAPGWSPRGSIPFSSARKWSARSFDGRGTWVLGAPEMVLAGHRDEEPRPRADELAAEGRRVLVLARTEAPLAADVLPADLRPVALVLFEERVRPDAADTLAFFAAQGVIVKVISGDNPRTVAAVARRVGVPGAEEGYDSRHLPDDEAAVSAILEHQSVFGRVSPHQKRQMVGALQRTGHVVAMTGDGVNDALALKDADIGIAMGSGAPATRAVAQLVLLDGRFATMPGVVAEGRRVIANIERVANLFVTKTVYALLLAVAVGVARWPYPFLPRHFTAIDALTIGIPGFFVALGPNTRRYVPGFLARVLRFTIPTGAVVAACTLVSYAISRAHDLPTTEAQTAATVTLLIAGLWVLAILVRPLTPPRVALLAAMIGLFVGGMFVAPLREFFAFTLPPAAELADAILAGLAGGAVLEVGWRWAARRGRTPLAAVSPSAAGPPGAAPTPGTGSRRAG